MRRRECSPAGALALLGALALFAAAARAEETATVVVAGREVAVLRGALLGYSATERAATSVLRIRDALSGGGRARFPSATRSRGSFSRSTAAAFSS